MAVWQAKRRGSNNFSMLVSHVLVPPAMRLILEFALQSGAGISSRRPRLHGDGLPANMKIWSNEFRVPIVVGGFEPVDLLEAILMLVAQLEEGRAEVENQYSRSVNLKETFPRRRIMQRGIRGCRSQMARASGRSRESGYRLRDEYAALRRRTGIRHGRLERRGTQGVHQRPGAAGAEKASRLPGLRHALHAHESAGRAHGFDRRRLRRLLPIQTPWPGLTTKSQPVNRAGDSDLPDAAENHGDRIVLGHGSGGRLSAELLREYSCRCFRTPCSTAWTTRRFSKLAERGWPSPPTPSWSSRCFSRAAISDRWRYTEP